MHESDSSISDDAATDPKRWHLIYQTRLGRVSILKNLDTRTARETYRRLKPDTRPKEYIYPTKEDGYQGGGISYGHSFSMGSNDDRLSSVHVIAPAGKQLDPWKGVDPEIVDLRKIWLMQQEQERAYLEQSADLVRKPIRVNPSAWTGR